MEVLYAIISILFIIAVIFLMVMLFRSNKSVHIPKFNGFKEKDDPNKDYKLEYNGPVNLTDTYKVGTVMVKITDKTDPNVEVTTYIDPTINKNGISIGRGPSCDYVIPSLMMDKLGSFLVKKIDNNYVLLANMKSANGIRETYGGETKNSICFKNGKCTCWVGSICFEFTDLCSPGAAKTQREESKADFYSGTIAATVINN